MIAPLFLRVFFFPSLVSLLLLFPLCVSPASSQSDLLNSVLQWSFCYQSAAPSLGYSVTISGTLLSKAIDFSNAQFTVTDALGIRRQTNPDGSVTLNKVIGIDRGGGSFGSDNKLNTHWPVLTSHGISLLLDGNVTIPSTNFSASTVTLYGEPPIELPLQPTTDTLSYFIYQTHNGDTTLQCPAPAPVSHVFYYTASDKHTREPFASSMWSSCASGIIDLQGPFAFPSQYSLAGRDVWIASNARGHRTFVNSTLSQTISLNGVNSLDGGDYIFYIDPPYVDNAGITMASNIPPLFASGVFPDYSYLNLWTPGDNTMYEAILPLTADNVVQFDLKVYVDDKTTPVKTCPLNRQSHRFHYCFYSTDGNTEVALGGNFITNAFNETDGSFWVTAFDGIRTSWSAAQRANHENTTYSLYNLNYYVTPSGHNNRVFSSNALFNSVDSLSPQIFLGGSLGGAEETLGGWPPKEGLNGLPNGVSVESVLGYEGSTNPVFSFFVYQEDLTVDIPYAGPPNPLGCGKSAQWKVSFMPFRYTVTHGNQLYSIFSEGVFSVIGPYSLPRVPLSPIFVVVGAVGRRVFTDSNGLQTESLIVGMSNITMTGSAQFLYASGMSSNGFSTGTFDVFGVSFALSTRAPFSDVLSDVVVLRANSDGIVNEIPFDSQMQRMGNADPKATFTIQFESPLAKNPLSSLSSSTSTDILPTLRFSPPPSTFSSTAIQSALSSVGIPWTSYTSNGDAITLSFGNADIWALALFVSFLSLQATFILQTFMFRAHVYKQGFLYTLLGILSSAVLGICGVWATEILFFSSLAFPCGNCIYSQSIAFDSSILSLSLIPAFVCCVPLVFFLSSQSSGMALFRRATRVVPISSKFLASLQSNGSKTSIRRRGNSSTNGESSASGGMKSRLPSSSPGMEDVQSSKATFSFLLLRFLSNVGGFTALLGFFLSASFILTRISLTYSLLGNFSLSQSLVSNVILSFGIFILCWVTMSLHVSGSAFRMAASILCPFIGLLDFAVNHSVAMGTFQSGKEFDWRAKSLSSHKLSSSSLYLIGGLLGLFSLFLLIVLKGLHLRLTKKHIQKQFNKTTLKLQTTHQKWANQTTVVHRLQILLAETTKCVSLMSSARPLASVDLQNSSQTSPSIRFSPGAAHFLLNIITPLIAPSDGDSRNTSSFVFHLLEISALKVQHALSVDSRTSNDQQDVHQRSLSHDHAVQRIPSALISAVHPADNSVAAQFASSLQSMDEGKRGTPTPERRQTASPSTEFGVSSVYRSLLHSLMDSVSSESSALLPPPHFEPTLEIVLSHPLTAEIFKDEVNEARCVENVMFLLALRNWKFLHFQFLSDSPITVQIASFILAEFIRSTGSFALNIHGGQRSDIEEKFEKGLPGVSTKLFDGVELEILHLLLTNHWAKFVKGESYTLCTFILWRNYHILMGDTKSDSQKNLIQQTATEGVAFPKSLLPFHRLMGQRGYEQFTKGNKGKEMEKSVEIVDEHPLEEDGVDNAFEEEDE